MRSRALGIALGALGIAGIAFAQDPAPAPQEETVKEWKIGEMVPDLTLRGSDGKDHKLRDLAGKRAFVIAWFPKAFTGG